MKDVLWAKVNIYFSYSFAFYIDTNQGLSQNINVKRSEI